MSGLASIGALASGGGNLIGSTQSTSGRSFVAPFQIPFLKDLFQRAQDFSQRGSFLGQDPLQTQGQNLALGSLGNLGIGGALQGGQFLTSGAVLDPRTNPYLAQTAMEATRPIFEGLTQNILPSLRGQAGQVGQVGSSRQGIAEGLASQEALRQAGGVSGDIFSRGYGQGLQALTQGLSLAPQTAQLGLLPSEVMSRIGGQRRAIDQERLLDPYTQLQRFAGLLGGPIVLQQNEGQQGSGLQGIAQGGGIFDFGRNLLGGGIFG